MSCYGRIRKNPHNFLHPDLQLNSGGAGGCVGGVWCPEPTVPKSSISDPDLLIPDPDPAF